MIDDLSIMDITMERSTVTIRLTCETNPDSDRSYVWASSRSVEHTTNGTYIVSRLMNELVDDACTWLGRHNGYREPDPQVRATRTCTIRIEQGGRTPVEHQVRSAEPQRIMAAAVCGLRDDIAAKLAKR